VHVRDITDVSGWDLFFNYINHIFYREKQMLDQECTIKQSSKHFMYSLSMLLIEIFMICRS
jgi:hypothetical protein